MRCPKQACCWALSSCCFHCLLLEHHLCADSIWTWLQRHGLVWLLFTLQVSSFWFTLPNHNRIYSCGFSQYFPLRIFFFDPGFSFPSWEFFYDQKHVQKSNIFTVLLTWNTVTWRRLCCWFKCIAFLSQFDSIHMESSKVSAILAGFSGEQFMVHLSFVCWW